jgi:hypothetical protein
MNLTDRNSKETPTDSDSNKDSIQLKKSMHEKIKNIYIEWSLRSNLDCYQKIFEYKNNPIARFIWIVILLISASLTFTLISKSIMEYFDFDVVSQIGIDYETKSKFVTVTICNNNPFTTAMAADLFENVSTINGVNTSHLKFFDHVKLVTGSPYFDDDKKKLLGFDFSEIKSCSFNGEKCNMSEFKWFWNYHYGNCWQFNSDGNLVSTSGVDFGLEITVNLLEFKNKYTSFIPEGLVIFIHNSSFNPFKFDSFALAKTGEKTFISVRKIFNYKQPDPYSQCIDLGLYSSDIYDLMIKANNTYRQSDCFKYCRQKLYVENCGCNIVFNDNDLKIYPNIRYCYNKTDYDCHFSQFNKFDRDKCIKNSCPLECDSVTYELGITSLVYPSYQFYNEQTNEVKSNKTYEAFKSAWVQFQVYYSTPEYTKIKESPKITIFELLGNIGGTLSIFVSLSIFTLFELVEILILVLHAFFIQKFY